MPTPVKTPLLTPTVNAAQPGSTFQTTVKNTTGQPMEVRITTQTLNGKHCGLTTVNTNVPWASVSSPSTFSLNPGASRVVTVSVAYHGPAGTNDLIVAGTHVIAPAPGQGATFGATAGYQVAVTYPGTVTANNAPCKAYGPVHRKHTVGALPPTVVHGGISPLLIGGIAALVLALVIIIAVMFRKLRKSH